jgi:hypothetical protein
LAGLAADGRTVVDRTDHLDRGYHRLDRKLRRLGARIGRVLYLRGTGEKVIQQESSCEVF